MQLFCFVIVISYFCMVTIPNINVLSTLIKYIYFLIILNLVKKLFLNFILFATMEELLDLCYYQWINKSNSILFGKNNAKVLFGKNND